MPLVRVEVRNEYGLGMPELYKDPAHKEDPKALLDGVAVAGLVGILRQLGDLAEFAAEVFHGVQEQLMNTSSRSQKLRVRVKNIEATIAPLEKIMLAQRSHLHFAYTTGSHWRARLRKEQNHFIYGDLPRFIMDSYEECRGPPRLHLLDKFDIGGPGSCLKRYSDPTFFRRASTGFDEAYVEKAPRDKKAHRRKKKRTWHKNAEVPLVVSHGTPISSHSGRMQYASGNFNGQTSPSQTVSTFDAALKSEVGDQSNSFDSRAGSGYIECILSPSYTMKSDGREPEAIYSQLNPAHVDTLDTSSLDEQSGILHDDIQEQADTRSSFVTWDEKTEILEPVEIMDPTNFNPDPPEGEVVDLQMDGQMDFEIDNETILVASVSGGNQVDDNIESETENYMDALNTIESESETDLECQTKREVEQFSTLTNKAVNGRMNQLTPQHSDNHSSNLESHDSAQLSSNRDICEENNISVSPESPKADNSSTLDNLPDIDSSGSDEVLEGSNAKSDVRNLPSLDSREPILQTLKSDMILSSSCGSQKSRSLPSGVTGINFWTNGSLLGLEPSKPPDFNVSNSVNLDSVAKIKEETLLPSTQGNTIEDSDGNTVKTNILENSKMLNQDLSSKCSTSYDNGQEEDCISIMKTSLRSSQPHLKVKLEPSASLDHSISSNRFRNLGFPETSTKIPGTEELVNPDVKNSSRMFDFSNILLGNGFQKKISHLGEGIPVSSVKNGVSEQKTEMTFKEQLGSGSLFMSPSSSPPLEHMKIYFQPINGFETSKLKLKFPDGTQCRESGGDMFPSFQLVPDQSISLNDLCSDSDDDTFCRSSRMSDDCPSHYSDSDSDEWEIPESPRCKDHEIYDSLCRISITESVSSNLESGRIAQGVIDNHGLQSPFTENDMEPSQSGRLLDLPSFETLNSSFGQELNNRSDETYRQGSDLFKEPTPLPPPLPPVEWRAMKPNPDIEIEKQDSPVQALRRVFDQNLLASTISPQRKPPPAKQDQDIKAIAMKSKQPDRQKVNGQKDDSQPSKGKEMDEKDDFLQQIRTKSFSLRRTMTDRSTLAPGGPPNVKVTAILEKANAIRQVVGSDDGEDDDNWSDV